MSICVDCGDGYRKVRARGLCKRCYERHKYLKTLHRFSKYKGIANADIDLADWVVVDRIVKAATNGAAIPPSSKEDKAAAAQVLVRDGWTATRIATAFRLNWKTARDLVTRFEAA